MNARQFRFRLQKLLELREEAERARALALTSAQNHAQAAHATREAIIAARTAGTASVAAATAHGNSVGTLRQMQFVLGAMDDRLQAADSHIVTAESVVRHAQDELRAAFQARHALETLRTKQSDAHRAAELSADRALMDEIALTRFHNAGNTPTDPERSTNG